MVTEMKPGDVFTRLTVESFSHKDSRGRKWWTCRCSCGNVRVVHTGNLRSGNTRSCGCYGRDARKQRRVSLHHSDVTAVILGYKRHAKSRGFAWELSREDVERLIFRDCVYCGSPPSNVKVGKNTLEPLRYSGIDRVDSSLGYVAGNVVPCCRVCNNAKSNLSLAEFRAWVQRLSAMAAQWGDYLINNRADVA